MSYTSVMKDGRFKTEDYAHAVAYVSFKLMGLTIRSPTSVPSRIGIRLSLPAVLRTRTSAPMWRPIRRISL